MMILFNICSSTFHFKGEMRFRAQEIAARTKMKHGELSENLLGPSQLSEALYTS